MKILAATLSVICGEHWQDLTIVSDMSCGCPGGELALALMMYLGRGSQFYYTCVFGAKLNQTFLEYSISCKRGGCQFLEEGKRQNKIRGVENTVTMRPSINIIN